MSPSGLRDYRDRSLAVAVKLAIAGRALEAARWRSVADRYDALLREPMPIYGGTS